MVIPSALVYRVWSDVTQVIPEECGERGEGIGFGRKDVRVWGEVSSYVIPVTTDLSVSKYILTKINF